MEAKIRIIFLALIIPAIATVSIKPLENTLENESSLLKHLKKLDTTFHVGDHKDIVLVLGMEGSDAITMTSLITSSESDSIGTENDIHNVNKASETREQYSSPAQSIITKGDAEFGTAFYVFPNFMTSRNAEEELSRIFVLQKLLNSAKSVKILIAIPYESLQNKQIFMELPQNLINMISDIERYRDGIAMVVTNVSSTDYLRSKIQNKNYLEGNKSFLSFSFQSGAEF